MSSIERSLIRYVALALGDEWEVRPTGGSLADEFARPFCRVGAATVATTTPIGARQTETRQTFSIVAFPTVAATPEASELEAARVENLLTIAFVRGIDPALSARGRAHPLRVPLFDYSGVAWGQPVGDDARLGVARVIEPPTASSAADPADARVFVVALDVRLSWTQSIAEPLTGELVQAVPSHGEVV